MWSNNNIYSSMQQLITILDYPVQWLSLSLLLHNYYSNNHHDKNQSRKRPCWKLINTHSYLFNLTYLLKITTSFAT